MKIQNQQLPFWSYQNITLVGMILLSLSLFGQGLPIPSTWDVNVNGYTGLLVIHNYSPNTHEINGTILGSNLKGFAVGRHVQFMREDTDQIYEGWVLDPALGAHGQSYYDGTLIFSGNVVEGKVNDGIYPWIATLQNVPPTPPNDAPIGYQGLVNCSVIRGWARDPNTTNPIDVHIYVDGPAGIGRNIGSFRADKYRGDIPFTDQNHGYEVPVPAWMKDGKSHSIHVYGIDDKGVGSKNVILNNSPKSLNCGSAIVPLYDIGGTWQEIDGGCAGSSWNVSTSGSHVNAINANIICVNGFKGGWTAQNIHWTTNTTLEYDIIFSNGRTAKHQVVFSNQNSGIVTELPNGVMVTLRRTSGSSVSLPFTDNFDQGLSNWDVSNIQPEYINNQLFWNEGNHQSIILKRAIPLENIVIEFDGWTSKNGFSIEWANDQHNGYNISPGAYYNTKTHVGRVAGGQYDWTINSGADIQLGKWQHYRFTHSGDLLIAYVDGRNVGVYDVASMFGGSGKLKISSYDSRLGIDNLQVYEFAYQK